MNRKFGTKFFAVFISLLMVMNSFAAPVALADDKILTEIASAQAGVSLTANNRDYTINESDAVNHNGTKATLDVTLEYKGEFEPKKVTVNGQDITSTYDSTAKTYDYTVDFTSIGKTDLSIVWTHEEDDTEPPYDKIDVDETETASITITRDNIKKRSVTFKCGENSGTYKYVPGEAYSVFKDDAEALLDGSETSTHTYSYDITWGSTAVDGAEFVATAKRKTFNISDVATEVKLEGGIALSGVTANVSLVKSTADETTVTDKAFVGGETEFTISLNNDLYKVNSVVSDTGDEITLGASSATAAFGSKPSKLTVYAVIDKDEVALELDSNKHFKGVDEKLEIGTDKNLPVQLTYEINGTETAAVNGKFAVNSATNKITVKASYDYGVTGVTPFEIELTDDNYFKDVPFEYTSSATPINDNGKLYFKADNVVVTTPAEVTIEDADSQTVAGEEQTDTTFKYTLGQGKFTSVSFGAVDAIYVDNTAPVVTFTNEADATGTDSASYTAFKTADNKVSFTVTDAVLGVKSVKLKRPDSSEEDVMGAADFKADVNGTYTLTVTDKVLGNKENYTIEVKANDETAPVIADATLPTAPTKEDSQTITFAVTELQSGFDEEDISIDKGATAVKNSDGSVSVTVTKNDVYNLSVTDNENHASAVKTFTIDNFDREAPSASLNLPAGGRNILSKIKAIFTKNQSDVVLSLSVEDVAEIGENASYVNIKDNTVKYYVYSLTDDDIKSDGTIEVSAANEASVKELMIAGGTGVETYDTTGSNPLITIQFGKYVVFVLAYDEAGNEIFAYSDGLVFDDSAPEISVVYNTDTAVTNGSTIYVNDAAALTASTVDPTASGQFVSGIQLTKVKINGTDWATNTLSENEKVLKEDVVKNTVPIALPTDDGKYEVEITVLDMCLNESTFSFTYYLDNNSPVPSDLTYEGGSVWSSSDVVSFKIDDVDAEGNDVVFTDDVKYTVSYDGGVTKSEEKTASAGTDNRYYIDSSLVVDGSYTMTVNVKGKDINGNEFDEDLTVAIKKDTVAPEATDFVLSVESSILNKLSFGIFGKKTVNVLVNVSNDASSAVNEAIAPLNDTAVVTYKKNGTLVEGETATLVSGENKYSFDLPYTEGEQLTYTEFKILAEDNAGNKKTAPTEMTKDNTAVAPSSAQDAEEIKNIGIMLEKNSAVITNDSISDSIYTFGTTPFYNKDVTATYSVEDTESGINEVVITANGKTETLSYASEKTTKKVYTYAPESGTVKDGETVIISGAENEPSDINTYNIAFSTKDNSLNESSENWTINVDSLSPRVEANRENKKEHTNADKVETTFDVTDAHFYDGDNNKYGVVEAVVNYNGVDKDLKIGGTTHSDSIDTDASGKSAVTLEYFDNDTVKLTFSKQGVYELKSIKIQDLVKNETNVDVSDVNSSVIIDRTAPVIESVTFEEPSLLDRFKAITQGTFALDQVKATFVFKSDSKGVNNDNEVDAQFASKLVKDTIKLKLFNADKYNDVSDILVTEFNPTSFSSDGKKKVERWTVEFVLPLNTQGRLKIDYADEAENKIENAEIANEKYKNSEDEHKKFYNSFPVDFNYKKDDEEKTDAVESNFFLSENTPATVDIVPDATDKADAADKIKAKTPEGDIIDSFIDDDNRLWFDRDVVVPIKVQDTNGGNESNKISGVYSVEIKVNGEPYEDKTIDSDKWEYNGKKHIYKIKDNGGVLNTDEWEFKVKTEELESDDNGGYKIEVKVVDFATNESEDTFTFYKDVEAPEVVDFRFNPINKDDTGDGNVTVVNLSSDEKSKGKGDTYGYYFNADTKVTVTAVDRNEQNDKEKGRNTGVKSITFYTVDYSNPNNPVTAAPITRTVSEPDENGYTTATFTVKANFKGQIFAYATDKIENSNHNDVATNKRYAVFKRTFNYGSQTDDVEVVVPRKTILETQTHHNNETDHIKYEVQTTTKYKDAKDFDLYSTSVKIKVTVKDVYAGIRDGEVVIKSDENREKETSSYPFSIDNSGKVSNGWTIDKTDDNLVTQISKVITVKRDSNNIELSATMRDRAYNSSKETLKKFSIDKTSPQVVVSYDNNSASESKYFKNVRTATIKVTERNFDPALFNVIKNGSRLNVSWTPTSYSKNTNKEGTVYTAKVPFTTDGDYTLSVNGTDRVNHKAKVTYTGTAPQAFTIDLIDPVVRVEYTSSASARNGNYYNKPRVARITVDEHNWNPDKFIFSLRMNDGSVTHPKLSWSNSGDTHTATYNADSVQGDKYTLDFECKDRADRDAKFRVNNRLVNNYPPEEFYVDQTNPKVTYEFNGNDTGSNTNATTNKEFASSATLSDKYYDYANITITGQVHSYNYKSSGVKSGKIDIDEIIEGISKDNKTKDDFYTLNIEAYDKAGNNTKIVRYFAVNRNGSLFKLSNAAEKLISKKYINNKDAFEGVSIQEMNVDPVQTTKSVLQLSADGKVTTLKAGKDYTVESGSTRGVNGYYNVYYNIKPEVFDKDAHYKLLITTVDAAGNTSKNSNKKGMYPTDKSLPILSFIHDETAPTIEINLDESMKDRSQYSIAASEYLVEFSPVDAGSGIDLNSVTLSIGKGEDERIIELNDKDYDFKYNEKTGVFSFVLKDNNDNVTFNFKDKAGNAFEKLVFRRITVTDNPIKRFFYNTPVFIGVLVGLVVLATGIIIFIATRKRRDDDEEAPAE